MAEARKQFTFYASYWEAMSGLKPTQRAAAYDAIIQYALFETQPDLKDPVVRMAFTLIKPTLDKGRAKSLSGKSGGSASPNGASKSQANGKQTAREKEIEVEVEREVELEIEIDNINNSTTEEDNNQLPSAEPATPADADDEVLGMFEEFWKSYGIISQEGREEALEAWKEHVKSWEDAERAKMAIGRYWMDCNAGRAKRVRAEVFLRKEAWRPRN